MSKKSMRDGSGRGGGENLRTVLLDEPAPGAGPPPVPSRLLSQRGVVCLCLAGFLMSFKPSEPFLTNFLVDVKGLSDKVVSDDVYPVWTYSFLACLLPAGLAAHALGARTVVAVGFAARLATRAILLWGEGLGAMQAMQVTFGLASACEPAFYSCAYAALPRRHFQRVTGYMQGAMLAGHLTAGLIGQVIVSSGKELRILFIISAVSVALATIVFICCAALQPRKSVTPSPRAAQLADEEVAASNNIELREELHAGSPQATVEEGDEDQESWVDILRQRGFKVRPKTEQAAMRATACLARISLSFYCLLLCVGAVHDAGVRVLSLWRSRLVRLLVARARSHRVGA